MIISLQRIQCIGDLEGSIKRYPNWEIAHWVKCLSFKPDHLSLNAQNPWKVRCSGASTLMTRWEPGTGKSLEAHGLVDQYIQESRTIKKPCLSQHRRLGSQTHWQKAESLGDQAPNTQHMGYSLFPLIITWLMVSHGSLCLVSISPHTANLGQTPKSEAQFLEKCESHLHSDNVLSHCGTVPNMDFISIFM